MSASNASTSGKSGKTAAKKPAAKAPATRSRALRPGLKGDGIVSPEDRMRFIAEAAYFKAEQRGFVGGDELGDWIEAEAEIDALLDSRGAG